MCGTGRISVPIVAAGLSLTCVDYSEGLLDCLRHKLQEKGLTASLHCMDVRELALDILFDLIFIGFNSFSEILTRVDQGLALRRIRSHLSNDGTFVCTLHNPAIRKKGLNNQVIDFGTYDVPDSKARVKVTGQYQLDAVTEMATGVQTYIETDRGGLILKETKLPVRFHLMSSDYFRDLAHENGLAVRHLYGDFDRSSFNESQSPFIIFVLNKQ